MTDPNSDPPVNATPFDAAWSLFANLAIGFALFAFVFLSAGTDSLFDPPDSPQEDWIDVNRAYFSALFAGGLLLVLGLLSIRALRVASPSLSPRLPRFRILEGEAGPRDRLVAVSGFVAILLLPAATVYSALYTYIGKSRVASHRELTEMGGSFWTSRWGAVSTPCEDRPCYRFFPHGESNQWFWYSDAGLALVLIGAVVAWLYFGVRLWRERNGSLPAE